MRYFYDRMRHLVCVPYSVENLHKMALDLGIKRCWFHSGASYPHYDVPKRRMPTIGLRAELVTSREILMICKGTHAEETNVEEIKEGEEGQSHDRQAGTSGGETEEGT